ncbi:processed acidic surface protein [Jeotgalibacillus proteolyticus]|uniref:Processed acidic surface protein n=1 Tax=Jeotgalibacillus proteolyticus TaxID=2082395 RepID=A0A2S5GBP6_9BACL|nr:processed acidic surface protein [Jeotgalibacillus proteolyticus]PPA70378.1 processed acidic surface protein [Jeotgalibacillus proteolyticus]
MKRLIAILLTVTMGFWALPSMTFALEANDAEFETFLEKNGLNKDEYVTYLESKGWTLEDFDTVDELGTPITEESIQTILVDFDLTREELNALLVDNGDLEAGEDVTEGTYLIFSEELYMFVEFYLTEYTPITDETLKQLLEEYGFESKEELEAFLNEHGDSIDNYEYIEDLDWAIYMYLDDYDFLEELSYLFSGIGLTYEELERLFAHLETLPYEDPAFEARLDSLLDRMFAIEDFETADELSDAELVELFNIYMELLDLFEFDTKYYVIQDGVTTPVTIEGLLTLDTTKNFDLLIEFYNKQGVFLADIILTADMFGSGLIKDTGKDIKEMEQVVKENPQAGAGGKKKINKKASEAAPVKTVKGAKLPKTASNSLGNTMAGMALVLIGIVLFRRFKTQGI